MNLNDGLTKNEFEIYLAAKNSKIKAFKIKNVVKWLEISKEKARFHIYRLYKKQFIGKVKNGLYYFKPDRQLFNLKETNQLKYNLNSIFVCKHLANPYFLSHQTALDLYGASQRRINTIYFTITKKIHPINNLNYQIKPIISKKENFFGYVEGEYQGESIFVSDTERTFLDIINRPELSGGMEDVINTIFDMEEGMIDYFKLLDYLKRFNKKILFQRLGFLFDTPQYKYYFNVPDKFVNSLLHQVNSVMYFDNNEKSGSLNKKWKVIVPNSVKYLLDRY